MILLTVMSTVTSTVGEKPQTEELSMNTSSWLEPYYWHWLRSYTVKY